MVRLAIVKLILARKIGNNQLGNVMQSFLRAKEMCNWESGPEAALSAFMCSFACSFLSGTTDKGIKQKFNNAFAMNPSMGAIQCHALDMKMIVNDGVILDGRLKKFYNSMQTRACLKNF